MMAHGDTPEVVPRNSAAGEGPGSFPLSAHQEFLRVVDHGDDTGPFGPRYTIVGGWRIKGRIRLEVMRQALHDVVVRHEALRTRMTPDAEVPYQTVLPPATPELTVRDLGAGDPDSRGLRAEEFLNDVEAGTFGMDRMPVVEAILGRFDDQDAVLALIGHHTAVDGWSMQIVVRDLAECYAARCEDREPRLPEARPYRDYVAWQREQAASPRAQRARAYWRELLRGAEVLPLPSDRPRSSQPDFVTGWHRFRLSDDLRPPTVDLASDLRSSPFMVMMSAYLILMHQRTGATDMVVTTFTPGLRPGWAHDTVGAFFNFVPLRVDISGRLTFRELVRRVRAHCLDAYTNEIPFIDIMEEAPDLMNPLLDDNSALCLFQVTQSPFILRQEQVGDLEYTAMRDRMVSQSVGCQVPDGALWSMELPRSGGVVGSIGYTSNLFEAATMINLVDDFEKVLRTWISAPDTQLNLG